MLHVRHREHSLLFGYVATPRSARGIPARWLYVLCYIVTLCYITVSDVPGHSSSVASVFKPLAFLTFRIQTDLAIVLCRVSAAGVSKFRSFIT